MDFQTAKANSGKLTVKSMLAISSTADVKVKESSLARKDRPLKETGSKISHGGKSLSSTRTDKNLKVNTSRGSAKAKAS